MHTNYLIHYINLPDYERRMLFIGVRARRLFSETTLALIAEGKQNDYLTTR